MPHFRTMDLNGPLYNQLSEDTFEFVDPSDGENGKDPSKQKQNQVLEDLRDILIPAEADPDQAHDAEFDNFVGFYEIVETDGGINTGPEDDIIA